MPKAIEGKGIEGVEEPMIYAKLSIVVIMRGTTRCQGVDELFSRRINEGDY